MNVAQHAVEPIERRRLLTVLEACQELRVSRWTVNRLIQTKRLHTIKIGSRRLVPTDSIREFIARAAIEVD